MESQSSSSPSSLYERNKGVFYVLLAQVFGVLMNVTTRILEVKGNNGQGMHPFQVRKYQKRASKLLETNSSKRSCSCG